MKGTAKCACMTGSFDSDICLVVSELGLTDPREIEVATIIAEETEAERERRRAAEVEHSEGRPKAIVPASLLDPDMFAYSYVDTLRWEELLTLGGCVFNCARRAGMTPEQILSFADGTCEAPGWLLFWFGQCLQALNVKASSDAEWALKARLYEATEAVQRRIQEGARNGGKKSAATRRKQARVPPAEVLRSDRERLLSQGVAERNITGLLAKKYNVTAGAIRLGFKRN
jgi:hypothetical protein